MLMFLLRAYMPDRFRHAHDDVRRPSEADPVAPLPVAAAMLALEPPPPLPPEQMLPPEDYADALDVATVMDGKLPHWHRYRRDDEECED